MKRTAQTAAFAAFAAAFAVAAIGAGCTSVPEKAGGLIKRVNINVE